jgi:hypothetical protein
MNGLDATLHNLAWCCVVLRGNLPECSSIPVQMRKLQW